MTNPKISLTAQDKTAAAFAAVSKRVDALGGNLGTLKSLSVSALGALAIPISAVGLVGITNEARAAIDGLKDLAEVSGSTVENVSALDKIARATGGTFDQVSGTLIKFNQVLKDADPDKGAGAVLKALNLDIEELKRLDPAEALRLTAVALQGFAENGDKARAYQELFGKSVKEAAPFLRDLAEQTKLQGNVSTKSADEVDEFNKQIARLRTSAEDAGRSLTIDLVTSLNEVIRTFKNANKEGENFLVTLAKQTEIYRLGRKAGQFAGLVDDPAQRFQPTFSPDDQSAAELARLTRRPSLVVPAKKEDPKTTRGGAPKDPTAEAQRYLEALQRQLEGTQQLTEVEQALRDLQLGRLGKVTDKQRESILNIAAEIDAAKEFDAIQKGFDELERERADRVKERGDLIKGLVDAGATQQLEAQRDVMLQLTEAYEKGELGIVGSEEAQRKYTEAAQAFLGIADEQKEKLSELDKFTQRAAENIQDALGDELTNILEGDFDNIGDSFTKMLNRMVAEAIAADLARSFGISKAGGSGGNVITSLLGSATSALFGTRGTAALASAAPGNSLDNFLALNNNFKSIPSFDVGTDYVPKDMMALIHKGEKIVPAKENASTRNADNGSRPIVVNVTATPGMQRATALEQGLQLGKGIQMAMARNG